jgi:HAD superfamily hydrolase (TIGR01509 family)
MIKLIIFDLDGVLVDAKKIHFDALNIALENVNPIYKINWDEHLSKYDGLKTNQKLDIIIKEKNLPNNYREKIWKEKQEITQKMLSSLEESNELKNVLDKLSKSGYKIACCSNSIKITVLTVLSNLGIDKYFNIILSNDDVKNPKPHPEIYWSAILKSGVLPNETLIIEDSPIGLLGAFHSNSYIYRVKTPKDVIYDKIINEIKIIESNNMCTIPKWVDNNLNVLIPMAGAGSRFESAGYESPKPLISVDGKPMIQLVIESLNIKANFIFIVQKKHNEKYNLKTLLNLITPNCKVIEVDGITEGAACTSLLAKDFIDNNMPLIISNSDQFINWNSNDFFYKMNETNSDGGILTFNSTHPKWSFVNVNENGLVSEVAEKKPISNIATVGVYYWKCGKDYVKYAQEMINKNIRVNNEFYICPVFNEAIINKKEIRVFPVKEMWGLGTPEDLNNYLINKKN